MKTNEGLLDRFIRAILGEVSLIAAYFWLWGTWQIVAYILALIMLVTAADGFCLIYKLFGWGTYKGSPAPKKAKWIFGVIFVLVAVAGIYTSDFFTRKFFLDDFNKMNNYYKQTLFNTGQDKRPESIANYNLLVSEFAAFSEKYTAYRPYVIRYDSAFDSDLLQALNIISGLMDKVYSGDLKEAHVEFEAIRPIFQEMLKRNGFSLLQVYLVDFHDAMEMVVDAADAKDPVGLIAAYTEADDKLKTIESVANDDEIKTIRANLDAVLELAKSGKTDELSTKAAELKSSFVKVYLVRG